MTGRVGVGVIGAGMISGMYLDNIVQFPDLELKAIADIDLQRATNRAGAYGIRAQTVEQLLASEDIEIVLNLTIPSAHYSVSRQILDSGKHVWSEKPLALNRSDASELIAYAQSKGLRMACAPDTFLGGALQTAQREVLAGRIGEPKSAVAIVQSPGPERVHPNPAFLYENGAGPILDMGPYYVTALVQIFGPIRRVSAISSTARPSRRVLVGPAAGTKFDVKVPTQHMALMEFYGGGSATLIASFESGIRRNMFEISGTQATLDVPNPNYTEGTARLAPMVGDEEVIPAKGSTWGRGVGVVDLARAVRSETAERASGVLALHVLDVLLSVEEAAISGYWVDVASTAEQPHPLSEDWDPTALTLPNRK